MKRFLSSALDKGAAVLYGVATAIDHVADWLSHRHRGGFGF